jgi:dTDP-glucose 4,6-dehydratase
MRHPLQSDLNQLLDYAPDIWESLRSARVFITGGTSFVGSWLIESLLWADDKLDLGVELVLLTRAPEAFATREPWITKHKAVKLLRGATQTFAAPEGNFDLLIHAATASYAADAEIVKSFDADITSTRRVLDFARKARVRRMLLTSSGAVYGKQPGTLSQIPEDYLGAPSTTDPKSAYGHAKRVSEFLCATYSRAYGFDAAIARMFTFVGPRLPLEHYAVGNFIRDAIEGRPIEIESDGSTVRSYLYAADMAIWLWTILLRGVSANPYNVGSPRALTVRKLAETVAGVVGEEVAVRVLARPGIPATRYVPDTSRAESELGLRVRISLEEGLKRTVEWQRLQWVGRGRTESTEVAQ